jgi:hypothetical protein
MQQVSFSTLAPMSKRKGLPDLRAVSMGSHVGRACTPLAMEGRHVCWPSDDFNANYLLECASQLSFVKSAPREQ